MDDETESAGALLMAGMVVLVLLGCVGVVVLVYWMMR